MKSKIYSKPRPYLAIILAHLIWGINYVAAKVTLTEVPLMSLAFLRFAFAVLLLIPFLTTLTQEEKKIKSADIPKIVLSSLLLVPISIVLFYEGLNRTTAINASTLTLITPVLAVIASWWFLKEKIYWVNLSGITTAVVGTILIIGLPLLFLGNFNTANFLGNVILILCSITTVAGSILSKDLLKKYTPFTLTFIAFLVGALTLAFPAFLDYKQNPGWIFNISILGILGLLYITILSTICAFFLFMYALKKLGVEQSHLFQYMEPAIAATLAVPFLGERISFSFIIGTCLIVLGVYWGTLGKIEHHHLIHRHHRG